MGGEGPPHYPQTPQKNTPPGTQPASFVVCSSGWSLTSQFHTGHKIITFFSGSISALGSISELSLWAWTRASGRCRPSSQLWGNKLSHTHCPTHSFSSSPYNRVCVCVLQKRYRAVYDYTAADEDEVSFQDGDMIMDVQQIDEGWMYGRVERTGQQGMLPANYVEVIWT